MKQTTKALAAVESPTGTLIHLMIGFFIGLSSGATVIISKSIIRLADSYSIGAR